MLLEKETPAMTENNTYVLDPESVAEMTRLIQLDQFTTRAMGGPLEEHPDPSQLRHILDLACGPGGWVLDVAFDYPETDVMGVDISETMIRYAIARAQSQQIPNASFGLMNITHPLDFADGSFDLVNSRFLVGALTRTSWPAFLQERLRITRTGGIIRLTETDNGGLGLTNSAAFEHFSHLITQAMKWAGYGFSPDGRTFGITPMLERLLQDAGCQHIQSRSYVINFSAGTKTWADFYRNTQIGFQAIQPLLLKAGLATQKDVDQMYEQTLIEMQQPDFCGVWPFMTSWGTRP
jgi:ubiquinone/menaquinone biosynthesis C-methylase UbiE